MLAATIEEAPTSTARFFGTELAVLPPITGGICGPCQGGGTVVHNECGGHGCRQCAGGTKRCSDCKGTGRVDDPPPPPPESTVGVRLM